MRTNPYARILLLAFLFCSVLGLAQVAAIGGGGTTNFIPRWTGSTTLGNSTIFQTVGGNVGVGNTTPATKLDVKGAFSIHGTSFSITNTGLVHFVSGQTFPGAGTITGVTPGTGLLGGGTSGNVTLRLDTGFTDGRYAQLATANTFAQVNTFNSFTVFNAAVLGGFGQFTVGAGTAIAASNNSNSQTLNLQNRATPSNSNFTEAQFNQNGSPTFFTDTLGDSTATGTKSAAVPLQSGKMVKLFSVESPEVWFDDYGSGQLVGGVITVALDPTFAQTANTSNGYRVFLTPTGDCKGLYVTQKTPGSFEVRELGGGQSNVEFDYRIVAHRKGYETTRLPVAKMPGPVAQNRPGSTW
jgi:hypothetical protein